MVDWLQEKLKTDREKRADLIAHIRNAPHFSRQDKKAWTYKDFLSEDEDEGMSPEEFESFMCQMAE
jgi:hypothetical protein